VFLEFCLVLEWFDGIKWMRVDALFFGSCSECSPYDLADLVLLHELERSYQTLFSEIDVLLYPFEALRRSLDGGFGFLWTHFESSLRAWVHYVRDISTVSA
jgi:hypothetical protein